MKRGSAREVSPGVWRLRYDLPPDPHDGKRRQGSGTVHGTEADAKRELAKRQADAERTASARTRSTVAAYLAEWWGDVKANLAESTQIAYGKQIEHLTRGLGSLRLERLTGQHVQRHYAAEQARGLGPGSIRLQHAVLRRALRQAKRWRLVTEAATDYVDLPRVRRAEPVVYGPADLARLLSTAAGGRLHAPLLVLLGTGLRPGELLALHWEDVDWETPLLRVRRTLRKTPEGLIFAPPKSDAGTRTFHLPKFTVTALREHQQQGSVDGLIFPAPQGGVWHPGTFWHAYERLTIAAGVERLTLHRFRHLNLSTLSRAGVSGRAIQARAGHANPAQTSHYLHVLDGEDADAAARLDAAFEGLLFKNRAKEG